jgi:branched-chain amino acid transport system permease protein
MSFSVIAQKVVSSVSVGSIYALVSVGVTLVFGLTRIVNFAHGSLMTVGAYIVVSMSPQGGASFWLAFVAAAAGVGLVSFALERLVFRRTIANPINGFIVSLGLILVIENLLAYKYGTNSQFVQPINKTVWNIGHTRVPVNSVITVIVTLALFAALHIILTRTSVGMALRAASADREMVMILGRPVERLFGVVFVVGGILAGVAGALLVTSAPVTPSTGDSYVVLGFTVALVGGLGNVMGALIGGILVGGVGSVLGYFGAGPWAQGGAFVVMVLVLLLRPRGLFGGAEGEIR